MDEEKIIRDSFVFYRSFFEAISELDEPQFNMCMRAICEYGLNGTLPTESGVTKTVFMLVKPQIDANNRRWVGGHKGGRPKKEQKELFEEKPKKKRGRKPKAKDEELPVQHPGENQREEPEEILEPAEKIKKKAEPKESFGEYCNVLLTQSEYTSLCESKGEELTNLAIKLMDEYIESLSPANKKEYRKKNHRMCLHNWAFGKAEKVLNEKKKREAAKNDNNFIIQPFKNPRENKFNMMMENEKTSDVWSDLEKKLLEN